MEMLNNNKSKIEYYEFLLEEIEEKIINLKLEENKIERAYNKSKKRIENFHIASNVIATALLGLVTSLLILSTNMIEILIVGVSLGGIILEVINEIVSGIHKSNNNINNIDKNINELKKIELEGKKKQIENILDIRNILNNILENNHIFNFEKEEFISKIVSCDDQVLDDFNIDELNEITFYLQDLEINNYSYDNGISIYTIDMGENKEKGYQKRLK